MCKHSQQDIASPHVDARPAAADCVQKRRAIAEGCWKLSAMRSRRSRLRLNPLGLRKLLQGAIQLSVFVLRRFVFGSVQKREP
ncbi:MAG: hypothetical protein V7K77_13520 [Nostoc sp.]|uniref:hypothetical protein n=1 Tax=Nostoc sp. TaxID=1180 RepID=UPI002FF774CE